MITCVWTNKVKNNMENTTEEKYEENLSIKSRRKQIRHENIFIVSVSTLYLYCSENHHSTCSWWLKSRSEGSYWDHCAFFLDKKEDLQWKDSRNLMPTWHSSSSLYFQKRGAGNRIMLTKIYIPSVVSELSLHDWESQTRCSISVSYSADKIITNITLDWC